MGAIYKNDISYSGGGGGTGETPTLEQVLTKGNSTTNNIYFDGSGNDDTTVSSSGVYTSGVGTEGMRQVTYNQHGISAVDNLVGTITNIFKVDFDNEEVAMSDGIKSAFKTALGVQGGAFVIDTANPCSYNELQTAISTPNVILIKHEGNVYPFVEKWESDETTKRYVNIASLQRQGIDKGAVYFFFEAVIGDFDSPMAYSSSFAQPTGKPYTDSVTGNLANLATTEKTNLVGAVNELKLGLDGLGEPFRVKQWGSNTLNVEIPYCTEDIANASIPKMVFSIDDVEGADYQIVGMIAYEIFDAASGGNRINCWPVCQFTGNGQKELSVRWMCAGTTRKTAKRISAWVLLKHR